MTVSTKYNIHIHNAEINIRNWKMFYILCKQNKRSNKNYKANAVNIIYQHTHLQICPSYTRPHTYTNTQTIFYTLHMNIELCTYALMQNKYE